MPLVRYKCNLCDNFIEKIIMNPKNIVGAIPCQCGGFLERKLGAPSSSSEEKIDSPVATKPVYYNRQRHEWVKEQGDRMLREHKEKESLNEEKK